MSTNTRSPRVRRAVITYVVLVIATIIFVGPILFMIWSAFRPSIDITSNPLNLGSQLSFANFIEIFEKFDFLKYTFNSIIIAGGSTLVGLVFGVPVAYVIVRLKLNGIAFVMLMARMAPGVMFLVPLFMISVAIGSAGSVPLNFATLIGAHLIVTFPLSVWLMIPFFEAIPRSLEEAAMIDGAAPWRRFIQVAFPLAVPGLGVAITLCFVYSWNTFLFALALATPDTFPLTVIAFNFIGEGQSNYGGLMAAAVMITLPAVIMAVFAQRWLVRGIAGGAVK